jgi:hypothetical protein
MAGKESIDTSGFEPQGATTPAADSAISLPPLYTGEHICTAACDTPPDSGIYETSVLGSGLNPTENRSPGSA